MHTPCTPHAHAYHTPFPPHIHTQFTPHSHHLHTTPSSLVDEFGRPVIMNTRFTPDSQYVPLHLLRNPFAPHSHRSHPIHTTTQARAFVDEYGLPVIIKAAMGGGGKGMRVVRKIEDLVPLFATASSEAKVHYTTR